MTAHSLKFDTFLQLEQARKALSALNREIGRIIKDEGSQGEVAEAFLESREVLRDIVKRIRAVRADTPANMTPFEWADLSKAQATLLHYALEMRDEQLQMRAEEYSAIIGQRLYPSISACQALLSQLFQQLHSPAAD